jgi:uncharacterized membrane protein YtjA (UPF0391 family)
VTVRPDVQRVGIEERVVQGPQRRIQCAARESCRTDLTTFSASCRWRDRERTSNLTTRYILQGMEVMLHYAIVFLVIALIAALLGFGGLAAGAAGIAKILFVVFLIGAVISFIMHSSRRI